MIDLNPPPPPERKRGLLASLGLTAKAVDPRGYDKPPRWQREEVGKSDDLERIVALPRRTPPTDEEQSQMAAVMTALLTKGPVESCRCAELRPGIKDPCITKLFPVQGWALWEAMQTGGMVGMLAAGAGKTALDVLLAMVVPSTTGKPVRACLLIPPNLRDQFAHDYLCWSQHFKVPNIAGSDGVHIAGRPKLDVLAYSELSHESCATWLTAHTPDILICDEAHALKDKDSVRTSRFLRFFIDHEGTRLFVHSGSLTTRSPDDYAHLAALSLREGSPLPLATVNVGEWAEALGPKPTLQPGELKALCRPGETARSGFQRRLVETAGVVTTEDKQIETPLVIQQRKIELPKVLTQALSLVRSGERPDTLTGFAMNEELVEKVEQIACARQVALGFFYRWCYPKGEPEELISKWFSRRKAWGRELRLKLEGNRLEGMDSPALLQAAAERCATGYKGPLPVWHSPSWPAWRDIAPQVYHEQETEWLDLTVVNDAIAWAKEAPGIVWYSHVEFGRKVAALGGFEIFEGGDEASAAIRKVDGKRSIVASSDAHGTGKNLQMFHRGLITAPFASGGKWEQVLARMHRYGQTAAQVTFDVYLHTKEMQGAFDSALEDAKYVRETTGKAERLLFAKRHTKGRAD